MDLAKREFVKRILKDEGDRMLRNQGIAMSKRLEFHSGQLYNNRHIKIEGDDSMDGKLVFTHSLHERFLDMNRTVKRKSGKGTRKKAGYGIHNRFVFGHYFSIAGRLMHEFTDEVAEGILRDFKQKTT